MPKTSFFEINFVIENRFWCSKIGLELKSCIVLKTYNYVLNYLQTATHEMKAWFKLFFVNLEATQLCVIETAIEMQ